MLKELKFVQGAVAKKDLLPAMTHFRIQNGTVRSYNGSMAISSPINLDLDCCPKASQLVKAISSCEEAVTIVGTPTGKLSIRSGPFKALIETIHGETPHVEPEGTEVLFDGAKVLEAFKVVEPFIGTDASRPFTNGVLLDNGSAFATNNVCLVQYWIGSAFPLRVNVPRAMVKEVIRVNEAPTHGQITEGSITFHYSDGRWIRSQLLNTEWPFDMISKLLDQPANPVALPEDFFTGLAVVRGMADGASRVYLTNGALRTHLDEDEGATYEIQLPGEGLYNIHMLTLLEGVVNTIDLARYPDPALFFGDNIRGAIVGMRM